MSVCGPSVTYFPPPSQTCARWARRTTSHETGIAGSPRMLQGSLLDYMPNICAPLAGSGWGSPAGALAVACALTNCRRRHGVSSSEVVCPATELVARRGTDRAVGPYSPISTAWAGLTRSGGQQTPPAAELPVAWTPSPGVPATWLVDLVALKCVLVGNWVALRAV